MANPLRLYSMTVKPGRLICVVRIAAKRYRYSNPDLAAFVQRQFPDLPHHACVNGKGTTFSCVIDSTSTPHLLEHLAISLQTQASASADATFLGTTEWIDEAVGTARIELSFCDDLEALRAFSEATLFLKNAMVTCLP